MVTAGDSRFPRRERTLGGTTLDVMKARPVLIAILVLVGLGSPAAASTTWSAPVGPTQALSVEGPASPVGLRAQAVEDAEAVLVRMDRPVDRGLARWIRWELLAGYLAGALVAAVAIGWWTRHLDSMDVDRGLLSAARTFARAPPTSSLA